MNVERPRLSRAGHGERQTEKKWSHFSKPHNETFHKFPFLRFKTRNQAKCLSTAPTRFFSEPGLDPPRVTFSLTKTCCQVNNSKQESEDS